MELRRRVEKPRSPAFAAFAEEQPRILRHRKPLSHPSDEDLSLGTPVARLATLRMTDQCNCEVLTQDTSWPGLQA
jgi:hypothetical protein